MKFERPTAVERRALLAQELAGVSISGKELDELVELTGAAKNNGVAYSFSDLRLRFLFAAVASAYPDGPLTFPILREALAKTSPSPLIK